MQKSAPSDHPIHEVLQQRWSPRAFSGKPVPPDVLRSLFEAARWAPSSANEQPWAFLVATRDDSETHTKLLSTLAESNQVWAQHAPVLGSSIARLNWAKTGQPNRTAFYDTGAAVAGLTAEATARGLFVHQMAGFDHQKASELFHIPSDWQPVAAFVLGYPGDPESLPEPYLTRERNARTRKPLSEFVMSCDWGKPARFLNS
jgi:nitroreductase